jgi:predicted ATPase
MTDKTPSVPPGIRLGRLVIENYKRLDHLEIDFPLPRMAGDLDIFVLGSRNGGGKTSVLECCSLLMLAGAVGEIKPRRYPESESLIGLLSLLVKAGRAKAVLKGDFQQGKNPCTVRVSIEEKGFDSPKVTGDCFPAETGSPQLRLATLEDALNSILALSSEPLIRPPLLHFNSYRKVQESNPELGMLAETYAQSPAYRVVRRLGAARMFTPVSAFKLEILRSLMGQASLFEGLDEQESETTLGTLNSLIDRYCGGRIEKLRPLPDNRVDIRIRPHNSDTSFSFDGLSSGQKEMIATLFLIWRNTAKAPGIVLIDEPELHLNAEWHGDFVEQLRRLAPDNQYILATHSEEIFRSVDESRRVVLVPDEDGPLL